MMKSKNQILAESLYAQSAVFVNAFIYCFTSPHPLFYSNTNELKNDLHRITIFYKSKLVEIHRDSAGIAISTKINRKSRIK